MNFLEETLLDLKQNDKRPEEIEWVGSADGRFCDSWQKFYELANFEYDAGYGRQEIPVDIVIVGDNWWMERSEYDGSECWEFKELPKPKKDAVVLLKLREKKKGWYDLEECHGR